jgi:hypothetical protein
MVPHQPDMNILRSHLVLKAKRDTAGAIVKYKARLFAGGDAQVHGLDFDKSYAPVADFTVVPTVLSIAARENRVVHSLDVSNAFVRASLPEFVYVRPPKILADLFASNVMKNTTKHCTDSSKLHSAGTRTWKGRSTRSRYSRPKLRVCMHTRPATS